MFHDPSEQISSRFRFHECSPNQTELFDYVFKTIEEMDRKRAEGVEEDFEDPNHPSKKKWPTTVFRQGYTCTKYSYVRKA